jgi:hypothetical protein
MAVRPVHSHELDVDGNDGGGSPKKKQRFNIKTRVL